MESRISDEIIYGFVEYIEKNATDHSTATTITELSEADSLKELARLSGAAQLTESVLANAKEMKDLAEKKKQN